MRAPSAAIARHNCSAVTIATPSASRGAAASAAAARAATDAGSEYGAGGAGTVIFAKAVESSFSAAAQSDSSSGVQKSSGCACVSRLTARSSAAERRFAAAGAAADSLCNPKPFRASESRLVIVSDAASSSSEPSSSEPSRMDRSMEDAGEADVWRFACGASSGDGGGLRPSLRSTLAARRPIALKPPRMNFELASAITHRALRLRRRSSL